MSGFQKAIEHVHLFAQQKDSTNRPTTRNKPDQAFGDICDWVLTQGRPNLDQ